MGYTGADAAQCSQAFPAAGDWLDVAHLGGGSDAFHRQVVELAPGERLDHGHGFWQDAIVFVTAGGLNVDCADGQCHRFAEGDILTLARLPIRSVYNGGTARLRLLVIRRTTPASTEGP